ncbi:MAG: hypothetical protein HOK72_04830 [Flavobacteriales bacterium]|jgi:predicted SAM-dependent methyltransferase|nr:hypothetical protein [Flavobacteriales bacterium]
MNENIKILVRSFFIKIPGVWDFFLSIRYFFLKRNAKNAIDRMRKNNAPINICIGASGDDYEGWFPTEQNFLDLLDEKTWINLFGATESVDGMLAEHVWEHMSLEDGQIAARMCFKFIKPGGFLRIAVPDGFTPDPEYIKAVDVGGIGRCADGHLMLYNHINFSEVFEQAGFKVNKLEYFDKDGNFVYNPWDIKTGKIKRSTAYRGIDKGVFNSSVILDAIKE